MSSMRELNFTRNPNVNISYNRNTHPVRVDSHLSYSPRIKANPINISPQQPRNTYNNYYNTGCIACDQAREYVQFSYPVYPSHYSG